MRRRVHGTWTVRAGERTFGSTMNEPAERRSASRTASRPLACPSRASTTSPFSTKKMPPSDSPPGRFTVTATV
jgi:hypothetical protein